MSDPTAPGSSYGACAAILEKLEEDDRRRVLAALVATFTAQRVERPQHNHPTREVLPAGQCPGCDLYHASRTA